MTIFLPNGIGETTGDTLVTSKPLTATGQVFYVSSATGDSGASGLNKGRPLNNLTNAMAAASNGDVIVLIDGHTESLTGVITVAKSLTIVGSGSSAGIPTVSFVGTASGFHYIHVTAAGVQLRNVRFKARTVTDATDRVRVGASSVTVIGCYFDCSGLDTGTGLSVDTAMANFTCKNCTFVSTATSATVTPGPGLDFAGTITDAHLEGLVFDGGTVGFLAGYAYVESGVATRRRGESITMIRGADALFNASSVQSYWLPTTSSADARIMI